MPGTSRTSKHASSAVATRLQVVENPDAPPRFHLSNGRLLCANLLRQVRLRHLALQPRIDDLPDDGELGLEFVVCAPTIWGLSCGRPRQPHRTRWAGPMGCHLLCILVHSIPRLAVYLAPVANAMHHDDLLLL